jgi:hypothetical protein
VQEGVLLLGRGLRAVDLGIDQHVREEQVALTDVLVVAGGVFPEAGAGPGEAVGRQMPAGHELVHEVGGPAHEAEVVIGPQLVVLALLHQLFARVRNEERRGDEIAGGGRRICHHLAVGRVELHVVLFGDGADGLLENGLGGDVGHPPATQVNARGGLLQGVDVVLSAASRHLLSPLVYG